MVPVKTLKESNLSGMAFVMAQRLAQSRRGPRLIVFPSTMYTGSGGDLRGWAIARELRRSGWRTIVVPPWLGLRRRSQILAREQPDVILMQQSRHPLNRPSLYPGFPCVFDADDADVLNAPELVADCCRGSRAVIAGNRFLARIFASFNPNVHVVWTGTYVDHVGGQIPNEARGPVIAWAHSDPLGYPAEAAFVHEVVLRLAGRRPFQFHLYGLRDRSAAGTYVEPLLERGVDVITHGMMRYRSFISSLGGVAIGLHPICAANPFSQGKSFGKLLAYMAANVAVVTSSAVDHPLFFRHGVNGMLANEDIGEWCENCLLLLEDPPRRGALVGEARVDFSRRLSISRAAELVGSVLCQVIAGSSGPQAPNGGTHPDIPDTSLSPISIPRYSIGVAENASRGTCR